MEQVANLKEFSVRMIAQLINKEIDKVFVIMFWENVYAMILFLYIYYIKIGRLMQLIKML